MISPLGDPDSSVVPVLNQWIKEGRKIKDFELRRIVRDLRTCRRYRQALEVSAIENDTLISRERNACIVYDVSCLLDEAKFFWFIE